MGHYCPNCGCQRYCRGDIDDIIFGESLDCDCCDEFSDYEYDPCEELDGGI